MAEITTSSPVKLRVKHWNAWLPGICGQEACRLWAQGLKAIDLSEGPDVSAVPAMLRRRLSGVGRVAAAVLWDLVPDGSSIPMVFCSQHGDQDRTLQLLSALGQREPLSPAAFSMSVHNSVAGVLSIAKKAKGAMTALAADEQMLSMGLIEAWGQLQNADEVLLVVYDLPLPEVYQQIDGVVYPYALALVLSLRDGTPVELGVSECANGDLPDEPEAVQWLRWFIDSAKERVLTVPGARCNRTWKK